MPDSLALSAVPMVETIHPPPTPWQVELELPASWQATHKIALKLAPGWDKATGRGCVHVEGWTISGETQSAVSELGSAPECLAMPEAPSSVVLAVGLVLLAVIGRKRQPGTSRSSV